jgi:hypothetical protein
MQPDVAENVVLRLAAILLLGLVGGAIGGALIGRMLVYLKHEGRLGL